MAPLAVAMVATVTKSLLFGNQVVFFVIQLIYLVHFRCDDKDDTDASLEAVLCALRAASMAI